MDKSNRTICPSSGRIEWIDVAKGMLISAVVFWHMLCIVEAGGRLGFVSRIVLLPFFMHTFFLITGMCTKFDKPFWVFVREKLCTLILPAIVFSCLIDVIHLRLSLSGFVAIFLRLGGHWFLRAMFITVVLCWLLHLIRNERLRIACAAFVSLLAVLCGIICEANNPWHWKQGAAMVVFTQLGYCARVHGLLENRKINPVWLAIIVGWGMMSYIYFVLQKNTPWFAFNFALRVQDVPIAYALAFGGSIAVLFVAREWILINFIQKALASLGRASLVIYLIHWQFLRSIPLPSFLPKPFDGLLLFVMVLVLSWLVSMVFHIRWFRWMIGRFNFLRTS